jgi:enoyl-CoA hydratase/carnithine racemase
VLTGALLAELKTCAIERVAHGDPWDEREYEMYPRTLKSPYGERRSAFGRERYSALGIVREDWEARQRAAIANWNCFGAPVAAIQGLCAGGGLELALRADVVFAGQTARFGHPEQSIGIVTLLGGIYRVAERAGRSRAIEWALTSEQVPAATMERHGVINRVGTYACARRP